MWTSGSTPAGSSSVPPRTKRTRALVYWLNTAIWQVGQRQIFCFLPTRGARRRCRIAREQLHAVGLDQQVDHERASGLPLAVQAMTAVDEERVEVRR